MLTNGLGESLLCQKAGILHFGILHRASLFWSMTLQQRHRIHYLSSARGQVAQIHLPSSSLLHSSYLVACSANDNSHLLSATADVAHAQSTSLSRQYTWADVKLQNRHLVPEEFFPITICPSAHVHYRPEEPGNSHPGSNPRSVADGICYIKFQLTHLWAGVFWGVCFTPCPIVSLWNYTPVAYRSWLNNTPLLDAFLFLLSSPTPALVFLLPFK